MRDDWRLPLHEDDDIIDHDARHEPIASLGRTSDDVEMTDVKHVEDTRHVSHHTIGIRVPFTDSHNSLRRIDLLGTQRLTDRLGIFADFDMLANTTVVHRTTDSTERPVRQLEVIHPNDRTSRYHFGNAIERKPTLATSKKK